LKSSHEGSHAYRFRERNFLRDDLRGGSP
jgi:hypothetical protein